MFLNRFATALVLGSSLMLSAVSVAADKPADAKPAAPAADAKPTADASGIKLTKPWSDLKLTDEQKVKINAIHKKALADTNAIEKKETEDITALLTDAQKAELKELGDKKKKEAAAKRAAEKAAEKPVEKK